MLEDSQFFDTPPRTDITAGGDAPELIHSSAGGWCELWRVEKEGRFRVYKALRPAFRGQQRYETLLRKEFEIGYNLSHPNICETYGYRDIHGIGNAIEMEWVDGCSLQDLLGRGEIPKATSRRIVLQLCDALGYIHSKQVIHRDIKPSNILITHNGANVKIIDFGLSDADAWAIHKSPAGTAAYAAPELLAGEAVDARADIWSLGIIVSLLMPSRRRIVRRCTAVERDGRYSDAAEVKAALQHHHAPRLVVTALICALALGTAVLSAYLHRGSPVEDEPVSSVTDAAAIDELFRQATELVGASGE